MIQFLTCHKLLTRDGEFEFKEVNVQVVPVSLSAAQLIITSAGQITKVYHDQRRLLRKSIIIVDEIRYSMNVIDPERATIKRQIFYHPFKNRCVMEDFKLKIPSRYLLKHYSLGELFEVPEWDEIQTIQFVN